jgi:hypothetical protein
MTHEELLAKAASQGKHIVLKPEYRKGPAYLVSAPYKWTLIADQATLFDLDQAEAHAARLNSTVAP